MCSSQQEHAACGLWGKMLHYPLNMRGLLYAVLPEAKQSSEAFTLKSGILTSTTVFQLLLFFFFEMLVLVFLFHAI